MKKVLAAALLALPLCLSANPSQAQSFQNPYQQRYSSWNQSFPGYQDGGSQYRRQVREMNPYGELHRSYQRERQETMQWLGR